jgi:uncharacterized protein (TIGR00730 family)
MGAMDLRKEQGSMELHFSRTNGPADEAIDRLIQMAGDIRHEGMVREMILAALKAGQENPRRADLKLMSSTVKEMRYTAKVFGAYHDFRKVTVFGSARTGEDEPIYAMARLFGRKLAEQDYMVITGGGPGIMQAVNEGAGPEHSFGVTIRLPFEQSANPVLEGNPRNINYKYFFNRKVAFLKESDAIALFPGGFGTLDEAMETLTLVQTGKRNPMPLVLIDQKGGSYWSRWIHFLEEELLSRGYVDAADLELFERVDTVESAIAKISRFYSRYHSLRYVGDVLVIRMSSPLEQHRVDELRTLFSDILRPGGTIKISGPLPEESDEKETHHLPRLVVDFARKSFGRLTGLIDAINRP